MRKTIPLLVAMTAMNAFANPPMEKAPVPINAPRIDASGRKLPSHAPTPPGEDARTDRHNLETDGPAGHRPPPMPGERPDSPPPPPPGMNGYQPQPDIRPMHPEERPE